MSAGSEPLDDIRRFWDDDAATYDHSRSHRPQHPVEVAAWSAALARVLPPAPATVLDVGCGTGFLSLLAAGLGHRVTGLDLSRAMLDRLDAKAADAGLEVTTVRGRADEPPAGPFDAVMERHLVWTLPEPLPTLEAWREVAPAGRLALFESMWGAASSPSEGLRNRGRLVVRRVRRVPPDHHGEYSSELRTSLPLGGGTPPAALVEMAGRAGWEPVRFERLRDIEWASTVGRPLVDRLLGATPRFVVTGGA